ncbi:hypothetical protein [Flagellimonas meishanensis]|nr:hypothetical protein [[Muricauda] meishanensis]
MDHKITTGLAIVPMKSEVFVAKTFLNRGYTEIIFLLTALKTYFCQL